MPRKRAGGEIAHRRRQHAERDRHMAAEQIVHQLRGALVGHDGRLHAGDRLEQLGREIAAGADRRGADVQLAAFLLGELDHLADGLGRERRMRQQRDRHRGEQADRGEVLARIEAGIGVKARVDRDRAGVAEEQRVAVRRAADHRAGADEARAADAIVDDHLMAEHAGEFFGDHARQHVDAAAGRIGHHQRHGLVRIVVLRRGRHGAPSAARCQGRKRQHPCRAAGHDVLPCRFVLLASQNSTAGPSAKSRRCYFRFDSGLRLGCFSGGWVDPRR